MTIYTKTLLERFQDNFVLLASGFEHMTSQLMPRIAFLTRIFTSLINHFARMGSQCPGEPSRGHLNPYSSHQLHFQEHVHPIE